MITKFLKHFKHVPALLSYAIVVVAVVSILSWVGADGKTSSGIGTRTFVLQDANDTSLSSTAYVTTDLSFSLAANQSVHVRYYVPVVSASTTAGVQFFINGPSGVSSYVASVAMYQVDSVVMSRTVTSEVAIARSFNVSGDSWAILEATIANGSTAGTVALEFHQATTDGSNGVIVRKGAFAEIVKY